MGLGRRQVFRLAKAYGKHGPQALGSRRRGRPSTRCYPTALRKAAIHATVLIEQYCLHHQAPPSPENQTNPADGAGILLTHRPPDLSISITTSILIKKCCQYPFFCTNSKRALDWPQEELSGHAIRSVGP